MQVSFNLNHSPIKLAVDPKARLIDILRQELHLTGTKESCSEGRCGSCSVLFNNKLQLACLIPAIRLQGAEVLTIEGVSHDGVPNYVQKAFIDADAIQCGYCIPGFIVAVTNYIENGGRNDRSDIEHALAGNLCRCTGYTKIFNAIDLAFKYKESANGNKTNL